MTFRALADHEYAIRVEVNEGNQDPMQSNKQSSETLELSVKTIFPLSTWDQLTSTFSGVLAPKPTENEAPDCSTLPVKSTNPYDLPKSRLGNEKTVKNETCLDLWRFYFLDWI